MKKEDLIKKYNLKERIVYNQQEERDKSVGFEKKIKSNLIHGLIDVSNSSDNCLIVLYKYNIDGSEELLIKVITYDIDFFDSILNSIQERYNINLLL